jgi:hypothetical protein
MQANIVLSFFSLNNLFSVLDASAKIPTGVMNLDLNWYGSYDECYSDATILETFGILPTTQSPVKGQYCTVSLNLPVPPGVKMVRITRLTSSGECPLH